jgi:hypothetical protein
MLIFIIFFVVIPAGAVAAGVGVLATGEYVLKT